MRNNQIDRTLLAGLLLTLSAHAATAATLPTTRCDSITGGAAKVTSHIPRGCVGCSVETPDAAADSQAASFASLTVLGLKYVAIRATAQPGIVFPAGGRAGVFYSEPDNNPNGDNIDSGGTWSYGVRTYLGGKLQSSGSNYYKVPAVDSGSNRFMFIETTQPYDAVELVISDTQLRIGSQSQVKVGSAPYKVYEICSDGDVSAYDGR